MIDTMKRITPLSLLVVATPAFAETAEQLRRAEEVGTGALRFLFGLALVVAIVVFYFSVLSRLGQIRNESMKHTKLLQQSAEAQKRQADALEELLKAQRAHEEGPPVLGN